MAAEEAVNASRVVTAGKQAIATGKTAAEQYGRAAMVRAAVVLERAVKEDATVKVMLKEVGRGEMGAARMRAGVVVAERLEQPMRASDFIRTQMAERGRTVELGITRGASAPPLTATARTAMREGRTAYFRAYDEAVIAGKSSVEANRAGRAAMGQTLGKQGVAVDALAFDHIERGVARLERAAQASGEIKPIDIAEVKRRVAQGASPGEFVVRVVWRGNVDKAKEGMETVMTRSQKAWFAPLDEVEGLRLNQTAVLDAVGFSKAEIASAKPGEYALMVYRTQDVTGVRLGVKANLVAEARGNVNFRAYKDASPEFWDKVMAFDYKPHFEKMKDEGISIVDAGKYAERLSPEDAELFKVRAGLHKDLGANENYGGRGITLSPDDVPEVEVKADGTKVELTNKQREERRMRVREFFVDNQRLVDTAPHAIIDLKP